MINRFLQQTATWYGKTGQNTNGEPTYNQTGTSIKVRFERRIKLLKSREGRDVVAEARIFCTDAVATGDRIAYGSRNYDVVAVTDGTGLDGSTRFYEVWLA